MLAKVAQNENRASHLFAKAQILYDNDRLDEALSACESAYDADAHRADNLLLLGAITFKTRDFRASIFYNQQCIEVDPNMGEAYNNLGNALKELGEVNMAMENYMKATKVKPRFADSYINLANLYAKTGSINEAIETYKLAISLNPLLYEAHNNLGNIYKLQNDYDQAKVCYSDAIKIKPDYAMAWNNLANIYRETGQFITAINHFKEAIQYDMNIDEIYINLGNTYRSTLQYDSAIEAYKKALDVYLKSMTSSPSSTTTTTTITNMTTPISIIQSTNDLSSTRNNNNNNNNSNTNMDKNHIAIIYNNLGVTYYEKQEYQTAIIYFKEAISHTRLFNEAYNNLGNIYRIVGRWEESIECYKEILKNKATDYHAYNNLGITLQACGYIKASIHCYVTAIRLSPTFIAAHINLGSIFHTQGHTDQAIAHYLEAIKIDPLLFEGYYNLGCIYKDSDEYEEAMKCYQSALRIKSTSIELHMNIGCLYTLLHQYSSALDHFNQALQLSPNNTQILLNMLHTLNEICLWNEGQHITYTNQIIEQIMSQVNIYYTYYPTKNTFIPTNNNSFYGNAIRRSFSNSSVLSSSINFDNTPRDVSPYQNRHNLKNRHITPYITPIQALFLPFTLSQLLSMNRIYAKKVKESTVWDEKQLIHKPKESGAKLRIGYVIVDFNDKSVFPLIQSLFTEYNREEFDITCYTLAPPPSAVTNHIAAMSTRVHHHTHSTHGSISTTPHSVVHTTHSTSHSVYSTAHTPHTIATVTSSVDNTVTPTGVDWYDLFQEHHIHVKDLSSYYYGDATEMICRDGIHILMNLCGYNNGCKNEIFAMKPAPIQMHYLGYDGTMGAEYYNYLIADHTVIPCNNYIHYQEKLILLPHSYLNYTPNVLLFPNNSNTNTVDSTSSNQLDKPDDLVISSNISIQPNEQDNNIISTTKSTSIVVITPASIGLPSDVFIYCYFDKPQYITPNIFKSWMNILKGVQKSILWLIRHSAEMEANLLLQAEKLGIDKSRLFFTDVVPYTEYIQRCQFAHLYLDTPLYNAHTTACDVLCCGVPVLTLPQEKMGSRVGASLLKACNLNELICNTYDEYETTAISLATDTDRYKKLCHILKKNKSSLPLFDTKRWMKHYEKGLVEAWNKHSQRQSPDHIIITD